MRFLAIDYGRKRTGLAVSDPAEKIASPLDVLLTNKLLMPQILQHIHRQNVRAVVVGLPLNMDGSEGPQAGLVRQFADQLQQHTNLPVYFYDERLTSFEADRKLAPAKLTRAKRSKRLDAIAAATILQSFLDSRQKSSGATCPPQ
jgi:putative Holliday junction resolvase